MTLTPSDLDRLEELAKAATPGKRTATPCAHDPECCGYLRFEDGTDLLKTDSGTYPPEMPDALFIAACDRETIMELVALARKAVEPRVFAVGRVETVISVHEPDPGLVIAVNGRRYIREDEVRRAFSTGPGNLSDHYWYSVPGSTPAPFTHGTIESRPDKPEEP